MNMKIYISRVRKNIHHALRTKMQFNPLRANPHRAGENTIEKKIRKYVSSYYSVVQRGIVKAWRFSAHQARPVLIAIQHRPAQSTQSRAREARPRRYLNVDLPSVCGE